MHSPKKKKKNLSSNTHQTEHVHVTTGSVCIRTIEGEDQRRPDQTAFYTMRRIKPLGSTVSITNMPYYIYRLILLLWV
ncbi:unnamed protein product [Staurois parvus]|uniref:Uncharacterized protein n=1 Tax=Staurois parvus TaxID=386267 RepID=A0ABN9E4N3_9NEOB|nr:unnamed protein product [Staurois parvus]